MSAALDVASWALLVGGALLLVVSALGLLRLPDFFTRVHAAGVADTGGVGLLLLGMALQTGFDLVTAKLVLIARRPGADGADRQPRGRPCGRSRRALARRLPGRPGGRRARRVGLNRWSSSTSSC